MLQSDGTSVYTPPASIYYEESDEESDRELRRSKRRPKRYESDEDFVLDSSDEAPRQISTFLCDDFDEGKSIRLVFQKLIFPLYQFGKTGRLVEWLAPLIWKRQVRSSIPGSGAVFSTDRSRYSFF